MDKPFVLVLISTYNGELFIREQILSVLNQSNVQVKIIIRDDGSQDSTTKIISDLIIKYPEISLIKDQNIGSKNSFFKLLEMAAHTSAEYIAFCDQDDIWDNNKLIEGTKKLIKYKNYPSLYCSNLKVVDSELNFIRYMYPKRIVSDKNTSLLNNIATGCTCIINRKLLDLFLKFPFPCNAVMHDWWLYSIASFLGKVVYDDRSFINYRQHSNNVYGARSTNYLKRLSNLIKSKFNNKSEHYRELQAINFYKTYYSILSSQDLNIINQIINYRSSFLNKLNLAFNFKDFYKLNFRIRIRIVLGLV